MVEELTADERFKHLFTTHFGAVLKYSIRRCETPADAADVTAEVFLALWRRQDDIPIGDEFPWLLNAAAKVLSNGRRGQLRRTQLANRLRAELTNASVVDSTFETDPRADAVGQAMQSLSAADQEVLKLTVWDGLTPSEIGRVLGLPSGSIRSRLSRARYRLRCATTAGNDLLDPTHSILNQPQDAS